MTVSGHPVSLIETNWTVARWRAMRALVAGQFDQCERWVEEAVRAGHRSGDEKAEHCSAVLLASLRREQERLAEAELLLRSRLGREPGDVIVPATLAAVLADLGRDSEARAYLEDLSADDFARLRASGQDGLPAAVALAGVCGALEDATRAEALVALLLPHSRCFAADAGGATCFGSAARALGVLLHALGRLDAAATHFEAAVEDHRRAGARVLLAHTGRQYSATLRARAAPGDWETAVALLRDAVDVYRELRIDRLAAQSEAVLMRSMDAL